MEVEHITQERTLKTLYYIHERGPPPEIVVVTSKENYVDGKQEGIAEYKCSKCQLYCRHREFVINTLLLK
jgi:hypothetical protein